MASGDLGSAELTEAYLRRIERLDPILHAVIETNPQALEIAARRDRDRAAGSASRPAPRDPGPGQGQHRHERRDGDDRRLAGPRRQPRPARCAAGGPAARGGRGHPRQGQPVRMGQLPWAGPARGQGCRPPSQRLERAWRLHPQPVPARPGIRAGRARARRSRPPRTCARSRSGPRPTGRSSARPDTTRSSGSSRRSGWSPRTGSSRSRTARTRPGRWSGP